MDPDQQLETAAQLHEKIRNLVESKTSQGQSKPKNGLAMLVAAQLGEALRILHEEANPRKITFIERRLTHGMFKVLPKMLMEHPHVHTKRRKGKVYFRLVLPKVAAVTNE